MSDFDKEAEREKLREKYEQDKEERKATQRMSDLLLKGATMTNAHCGTCGDPLFQEDGTTFCPSCHGNPDAVQGTDLEAQPAVEGETDGNTGADTGGDDPAPTNGATTDTGDGDSSSLPSETAAATDAPSAGRQRDDQRRQETRTDATAPATDPQSSSSPSSAKPEQPTPSQPAVSASDRNRSFHSSDGDLEAAHDALVRSLEKFAEKAAATDDPRYAKECLEAAREAGEALTTLR
ncbi:Sjogren's syndrome/scleroderma autoantigen 1 family protein [Natrinema longum]|uniref:Sjogren's syndrome/scleroderma autoantigen 1 (Autoantigen p27) n=1 Tax=Natrinema longum TaxID=370324 RepID=A0A8A2U4Z5_9EURY|nr:Sjogren's syndrome/scleroderma autoantigen 1 family protein [Natrinema longum]MBZ6495095.1 hypothetical protein [Natrinema longum]QSW83612.1 hypothetical protein J0X27_08945 [Natrinema longum]